MEPVALAAAGAGLIVLLLLVVLAVRRRRRAAAAPPAHDEQAAPGEPLRRGLGKTRAGLLGRLTPLLGRAGLDDAALADVEAALLAADVGASMTGRLLAAVRDGARTDEPVRAALERELVTILREPEGRAAPPPAAPPYVIMVVGVNGAGKTTTIGKLACRYQARGQRTLVVAADTFRAAAIEQLAVWAERAGAELVRQQQGGDPGAVVYDGMRAALARRADVVIVDTAGRLHTKRNLMDELRKLRRVITRAVPDAPHETLLVLDAVTGQNGLVQARVFLEDLGVTAVALTKLDGSAKGGVVVPIAGELGIPVRYVGVGETVADLRDFDAADFARALLAPPDPPASP